MQIGHGQITLDNVSWTPLRAPIDCRRVNFVNVTAANMKLRTNSSDATTEVVIPSLQDYVVPALQNAMIRDDDILLYGQLSTGTAAIKSIASI